MLSITDLSLMNHFSKNNGGRKDAEKREECKKKIKKYV